MKTFWKDFCMRGMCAAWGGPVVMAIVYAILGATGVVESLGTDELAFGILTVTALAFTVAGMTAIYQLERLPLPCAILIHCIALYVVYIGIYLVNGWLKSQLIPVLIFTGVFVVGYALIWLCIYLSIKDKTNIINSKLSKNK